MTQTSQNSFAAMKAAPLSTRLVAAWQHVFYWTLLAALVLAVPLTRDADLIPTIPVAAWISDAMDFALNDLVVFGIEFKTVTRAMANLIDMPADFLRGLLSEGFSFDWGNDYIEMPPLSWVGLAGLFVATSWHIGGRKIGIFAAFVCAYLLVFDLWAAATLTVSSILLAVPLSIAAGVFLGLLAFRNVALRRILNPILDLMQTVPIFAYMVPVLLLFGFGAASAIAATMIYAIPPMVRATITGLERVPKSLLDLGEMVGASRRTTTWSILVPSARPLIMVGVNQVIMNSLNMVIIASMIGAGGLGFEVLDALRKLRLGQGAEAGIAITLLAILFDRLSQTTAKQDQPALGVSKVVWGTLLILTAVTSAGAYASAYLAGFPSQWTITTEPLWDAAFEWLTLHAFDTLETVKVFVLTTIMFPIREALSGAPWLLVLGGTAWLGFVVGGARLAVQIIGLLGFILFAGIWELAMLTLYLCGSGVALAYVCGTTIGVLTFRRPRARRGALFVADLLQTLPSFVYLIPVVMLFRVGDFAAVVAVAAYAIAPAIRYSIHGLSGVPSGLSDVASVAGCTDAQKLRKVEMPMAVPELLLGLNQTIMMGLAMVVITALVGTNDLGQEVYIALAKVDPGRGIVAGLGVAFLAMVLDRLVTGAAAQYRQKAIG